MSGELKKEFNPRDVQRMRNIITGKTGDRTQIQTGYEKNQEVHKEGDVWEENGKKWTIKRGIKQSVTKLDEIKKLVVLPLSCPNCGKVMKVDEYNKKMWAIHQKCFDCVIKMESEIKRQGKWDEYCSNIMNRNKNTELDDLEAALEQWVTEKDSFVSEAGEVEKWGGGDRRDIYKQVKDEIAKLKKVDIYNGKNTEENGSEHQKEEKS
jgi:hypothetical protein